ncbi:MAG TPA: acyl-CoA thioesterase [Solirubrobacteraceae bacterium]|nr:acyl-CoA thioesterase [Solirubrobacteraceae bacterium]
MSYRYRVGFTDVDFARIMFSGDYYRWAERGFEAWCQESGLHWRRMIEDLAVGLPSIETRCHHLAPLAYEDEFDVCLGVRDLTDRGFVSDFELYRVKDGVLAAHGYFNRRFLDMRTLRGRSDIPEEAAAVFRALEAQTDLMPYADRREQLRSARQSTQPATTPGA